MSMGRLKNKPAGAWCLHGLGLRRFHSNTISNNFTKLKLYRWLFCQKRKLSFTLPFKQPLWSSCHDNIHCSPHVVMTPREGMRVTNLKCKRIWEKIEWFTAGFQWKAELTEHWSTETRCPQTQVGKVLVTQGSPSTRRRLSSSGMHPLPSSSDSWPGCMFVWAPGSQWRRACHGTLWWMSLLSDGRSRGL